MRHQPGIEGEGKAKETGGSSVLKVNDTCELAAQIDVCCCGYHCFALTRHNCHPTYLFLVFDMTLMQIDVNDIRNKYDPTCQPRSASLDTSTILLIPGAACARTKQLRPHASSSLTYLIHR